MENQQSTKFKNPMEYLKIFFRRKWLFIAPAFAGLVIGIIASLLLPPAYQSSTIILVEEEKIINPLIQNLAVSTTAAQRMQSIKEIILGWNSLVELTKKLNLAKNVQNQLQFEGLIFGLRRNISVQMRQPNIIQIAYEGKEPKQTQLVTQTLTDILVNKNLESQTKETDVAINFITEQLAIYKRKIKESEVAELEDQLKKLLVDSTEQHPLVKELRQKLNIAKKELDSGNYEIAGSEKPINDATRLVMKQELDKIIEKQAQAPAGILAPANEQGADTNNAIYKLMLMDKVGDTLARDIDVNKNIYNMLLQRLETAKITQRLETSKQGTRYTILDPARLPLKASKPNKVQVIFLWLFLGAAIGAGLVFGTELMNSSFLDIDDAKEKLEFPVLGAISRLTTQEEIEKEKYKKKKWIISTATLSTVLIIVSLLISFFKK